MSTTIHNPTGLCFDAATNGVSESMEQGGQIRKCAAHMGGLADFKGIHPISAGCRIVIAVGVNAFRVCSWCSR